MPRKPVVAKEEAQKIANEVFSMQVIPDAQIQQEKTIQQIRTETVEHLAAMNNLAVATLGEVMRSKTASDSCRLKAAQIALSYGVGRPHEAEYIDDTGRASTTRKVHAIMLDVENQEKIREEIDKAYDDE